MEKIESLKLPMLLYDSECTFCNRFKMSLERIDKDNRINFETIHNSSIYSTFPGLTPDKCHETVHLIDEQQKIYKGPEVISYLLNQYPSVKKFSWLLESDMGKKAIDIFYESVNSIRKSSLNPCPKCKKKKS